MWLWLFGCISSASRIPPSRLSHACWISINSWCSVVFVARHGEPNVWANSATSVCDTSFVLFRRSNYGVKLKLMMRYYSASSAGMQQQSGCRLGSFTQSTQFCFSTTTIKSTHQHAVHCDVIEMIAFGEICCWNNYHHHDNYHELSKIAGRTFCSWLVVWQMGMRRGLMNTISLQLAATSVSHMIN